TAKLQAIEGRVKELRAAGDAPGADRLEVRLDQVRESILASRSGSGTALDAGVHVVGVYEPADASNPDVKVFVPATRGPIVLVLTAYETVRWNVEASPGAKIERILIGGYEVPAKGAMPAGVSIQVRSTVGGDTPSFYSYEEDDEEFAETRNVVRDLTGKEIATTTGQYTGPRGTPLCAGGGQAQSERWQRLDLLDELHRSLFSATQETTVLDAEELAAWQVRDGKTIAADATIEWTAEKQGSLIGRKGVPRDWSGFGAIQFKIHSDSDQAASFEVQAQVQFPSRFWRKVTVEGKGWHTVTLPLYQFRRTSAPVWSDIAWLVFNTRQPGTYRVDEIKLLPAKEGQSPFVEPDADLLKRAFPAADKPGLYKNERFRIASEFEIDGAKLLKRLDDLWERFRARLGVAGPFGSPATLVIFRDAKPYQDFCAATARDLFAASLGSVTADGYTFYEYSASSWSDTWKEERPVYFHEVCHQLISRHLRLEDDQKWFQEGFAALFQMQMYPEKERADAAAWVRRLPESQNRIALESLDARFAPKTSQYVQCLALVDYLASGKDWPQTLAALQQSKSLKEAVESVLKTDLGSFEQAWLEFCRDYK
ncbi:MAG TPA: hypothetical protein VI643_05265, partial [Planctomycetota bacterium]|nr:hypothetical protein [Planctomycetota bacterium]